MSCATVTKHSNSNLGLKFQKGAPVDDQLREVFMNTLSKFENFVDEALYERHRPLFEIVLTKSAKDEECFEHRVRTFVYHGLLDFFSPHPYKQKPFVEQYNENENGERVYTFTENQLAHPAWKRRLLRKLKARRPNMYVRHRLTISRDQIISDAKYVSDIARVLAYGWAGLLGGRYSKVDYTILNALMDENALSHFLDSSGFDNLSAAGMATFLLRRETERFFDKSGKLKDFLLDFETKLSLVGKRSLVELEQIVKDSSTVAKVSLDEVLAQVGDSCRFVEEIYEWSKELKEHAGAMRRNLQEQKLTEESFQQAVDVRIARAARKRLLARQRKRRRSLWYMLSMRVLLTCVALWVMFHIEFGYAHITIVDLIKLLVS